MTRIRPFSLVLVLCAVLLAACGSQHVTPSVPTPQPPVKPKVSSCPPGQSFMGCAVPKQGLKALPPTAAPPGNLFPDVSSWQGHPDWVAARPVIAGASIKAGEYVQDPVFAWNVAQLKALHIRWLPYWFVRNTGCASEGAQLVSVIRSVGGLTSGPVILDIEAPEAAGYAPCLDAVVFDAFHRHSVIYTAPGTWPGGSNAGLPVWQATYGPFFSPVWHPVVAWQFTDGVFGSRVFIPGIGYGDVSVDYGLLGLQPAPPPDPYAVFAVGPFPSKWGQLNERLTVRQFDGAVKHPRKYRAYLRYVLQPKLRFLANRTAYVALVLHHGWHRDYLGSRYQLLIHRATRKI